MFIEELSPLENVSKYLREKGYSFVKIGEILNRSDKTIWQAYKNSQDKYPDKFSGNEPKYLIPVSLFADRSFSVFEIIVSYLIDEFNLRYCEVAGILKRDDRTIWTVYNRAKNKE